MNIVNSSFLCLDINSDNVGGIAHYIRDGRIIKSVLHMANVENNDVTYAIKTVLEELDSKTGIRFDTAYITGEFGQSFFNVNLVTCRWDKNHLVNNADMLAEIKKIENHPELCLFHIIPSGYTDGLSGIESTPVGKKCKILKSRFNVIRYQKNDIENIISMLKKTYIHAKSFQDKAFLISTKYSRKNENSLQIEMGGDFTTVSIWRSGFPVVFKKIPAGQNSIVKKIQSELNIPYNEARDLKNSSADIFTNSSDSFNIINLAYKYTKDDINSIIIQEIWDILETIKTVVNPFTEKYRLNNIYIYGTGSNIKNLDKYFAEEFDAPATILEADEALQCFSKRLFSNPDKKEKTSIWFENKITDKIANLFTKKETFFNPIFPSTMAFDVNNEWTYSQFKSADISCVHIDITDGFFVNTIYGNIDDIKTIKKNSNLKTQVHLMTETPVVLGKQAINAGADTVILSAEAIGSKNAISELKKIGGRVGLAINPNTSIHVLTDVIKQLDDVLILAVEPGMGGQTFKPDVLSKVKSLVATRDKYKLNFKITVDGGINDTVAKLCWAAGADYLVSGAHLKSAPDFPLAVNNLLKK